MVLLFACDGCDELLVFSDDKCINLEEFEKLSYIVSMPFVKLNDADHKWRCSIFLFLAYSSHPLLCAAGFKGFVLS